MLRIVAGRKKKGWELEMTLIHRITHFIHGDNRFRKRFIKIYDMKNNSRDLLVPKPLGQRRLEKLVDIAVQNTLRVGVFHTCA